MKLQNFIIIFLAIALPVILVLSYYVGLQVDTATLKANYNSYLSKATHETMSAFQINTTEDAFLTVADAKIRDIEASLNVFSSTLATYFEMSGASKSQIMSYVPALLFTLYDGYYIYTPTKSWDTGSLSHELKPYVNYAKSYSNGSRYLAINYTLDNYVAVYYYDGNSYESKAGYLEVIPTNQDAFLNGLSEEAKNYYREAWSYTSWFNGVIDKIDTAETDLLKINSSNTPLPREASTFNDEKYEVIKNCITNNLIQAMHIYGKNAAKEFEMPKLTDSDWDIILNNVCFISFIQGIPVGTTMYNNYCIVISSENKEIVSETTTYYLNVDENGNPIGSYHRLWCPHLSGESKIIGASGVEFKNQESSKYKSVPACYYCVVRGSSPSFDKVNDYYTKNSNPIDYNLSARQKAYFSSMAMQKLNLSKLSSFISGSKKLTK